MLKENLSLYFASKKVMKLTPEISKKEKNKNIDTDNDKIEKVIEKHVYRYFYNMQIAENLFQHKQVYRCFFSQHCYQKL